MSIQENTSQPPNRLINKIPVGFIPRVPRLGFVEPAPAKAEYARRWTVKVKHLAAAGVIVYIAGGLTMHDVVGRLAEPKAGAATAIASTTPPTTALAASKASAGSL